MGKKWFVPGCFLLLFILWALGWTTKPAIAKESLDGITIHVSPINPVRGSQVTLSARGLPRFQYVEAGLRTPDGRRELLQSGWTDVEGRLQMMMTLPETARAGETWLGVVKLQAREELLYTSNNHLVVARGSFIYRVRQGDTLGEIAGWFHTKIDHILEANPQIKRANRIIAGQELAIPVGSAEVKITSPWEGYRVPDYSGPDWRRSLVKGVLGEVWEEIQGEERWIEVDLSAQLARAYQGTEMVRLFVVSTGRSRTPTITGSYHIYVKHRAVDMSGPGYHLEDVPYTMYFYQGYGLHGTYWHNNFGRPMSHGCVNLSLEDAEWLYGFGEVGTLVYIHQ